MTFKTNVTDDQLGAYYRKTAAIADRLGKSLDPAKIMTALQRIHDGELGPVVLRAGEFPVYLECDVGGASYQALLAELESAGFFVSDWVKDIMKKPAWKPGEKEMVKFGRAKVSELGFTKNPTTREIWARIRELGHSLCEPCDGPAIRLALKDQPRGDYFWTAMEQITDSRGDPYVFCVERSGGGVRWLGAGWAYLDGGWGLGCGIVFRLCK